MLGELIYVVKINPISTGEGLGGNECNHRGIFLSRTLERQMIFMVNKMLKKFFRKNLPIVCNDSVLSRASDDIFTYSFCVVKFIGNYVKSSLKESFKHNF